MARISSGTNSKQNYQTPKALITACEKRFGPITVDLAACSYNKVCDRYIGPPEEGVVTLENVKDLIATDSLTYPWAGLTKLYGGVLWLNPPFNDIPTWAEQCEIEAEEGANILFLIPYGTTKGFMKHVVGKADLYMLIGRLAFIPGESFPKDCVICHYHKNSGDNLYFWDWKHDMLCGTFINTGV
jgi:hypothetical protein